MLGPVSTRKENNNNNNNNFFIFDFNIIKKMRESQIKLKLLKKNDVF